MDVYQISSMKGGWFVGNFEPTAYKTDQFEVSYKTHPKGDKWDAHYHIEAVEINYLIRGKMTIQGRELAAGDVFVLNSYEVADPEFLEDCELIVVKTPSVLGDKYSV